MGGVRIADTTGDATSKNRRLHIVGRSTAPASDFIDSIGQKRKWASPSDAQHWRSDIFTADCRGAPRGRGVPRSMLRPLQIGPPIVTSLSHSRSGVSDHVLDLPCRLVRANPAG